MDTTDTTRATGYIGSDQGSVLARRLYNYCRLHRNGFSAFYHDAMMRGGVTQCNRVFNIAMRRVVSNSYPANLHFSAPGLAATGHGRPRHRSRPAGFIFVRVAQPPRLASKCLCAATLGLSSVIHLLPSRTCIHPEAARNLQCIDGAITWSDASGPERV